MADDAIVFSVSLSGNTWNNAAMASFFSRLKTEHITRSVYRIRNEAEAVVFDHIKRFQNSNGRYSRI